jgi:TM2 domain-containing membrane protein YozV
MEIKLQKLRFVFLLIFALPLPAKVNAQGKAINSMHSPVNVRKFADYLFCRKDYLRSFYEYRNYLKSESNDTVRFKIAIAFQQMQRYTEALDNFKGLFFNSDFVNSARNEFFKTLFLDDSLNYIRQIAGNSFYQTEDSLKIPLKLSLASGLLLNEALPDSSLFSRVFSTPDSKKMIGFYSRRKNLPYKNPTTAALLSTVIPGLGKIYTENYSDGITAFLFSTVLGYIAYDNFRAHHSFRAWLFTGLTGLFYGGNIYGSYAAAQIFNAKVRFNFTEEVKSFLKKKNYFIPEYKFLCR